MLTSKSEYSFPIFISSAHYNLVDLRAELSRYLTELGYKPILSSEQGFHDNSQVMEPWESCLEVLDTTFVMILIIDSKYGQKLEWKNFEGVIGNRKVSPTHAEYLFARKKNMRMLVFIREELSTYYQTYRAALRSAKNDKVKAQKMLKKTLPENVSFDILEFIEEVKTSRPILWITEFKTVTDIKQEIQKKMLNELAQLFLFKNKHLESVILAFSTILNELPEDKRKETLHRIGTTKELILEIEEQTKLVLELKVDKDKLLSQFKEKSEELEIAKKEKKEEISVLKETIKELSTKLKQIDTKIHTHETTSANYLINGSSIGETIGVNPLSTNIFQNSLLENSVSKSLSALISEVNGMSGISSAVNQLSIGMNTASGLASAISAFSKPIELNLGISAASGLASAISSFQRPTDLGLGVSAINGLAPTISSLSKPSDLSIGIKSLSDMTAGITAAINQFEMPKLNAGIILSSGLSCRKCNSISILKTCVQCQKSLCSKCFDETIRVGEVITNKCKDCKKTT